MEQHLTGREVAGDSLLFQPFQISTTQAAEKTFARLSLLTTSTVHIAPRPNCHINETVRMIQIILGTFDFR